MTIKRLYGEIAKTEVQDDGTIKVWGYASSESQDSDGETITADAMKAALPDYMKFGAVREMHQAKAAGTAIEAEVQADGRMFFGAHVVDSEAVKKVKANVYKGFSIGGKVTARDELNKSVIKGLKLVEVSLVDRPANPDAVFTMFKADGIEQLDELVEKSLWSVSDFAQALNSLSHICSSTQWEANAEGDNSPVPAQLRAWLTQGVEIFKTLAAEELAEMLAELKEQAGEIDVVQLAAKGDDLAKAGARYSKTTKASLAEVHKMLRDCDQKLAALGYEDAEEAEDGDSEKLAKVSGAHDDLIKVIGAAGCPEGEIAAEFVAKMAADNESLKKRVKELEDEPAGPKAALKVIEKGEDISETVEKSEVPPGTTPEEQAMHEIKKAHKTGGRRLFG